MERMTYDRWLNERNDFKKLVFGDDIDNNYKLNHRYQYEWKAKPDDPPSYYHDWLIIHQLIYELSCVKWDIQEKMEECIKTWKYSTFMADLFDVEELLHVLDCLYYLYSWRDRFRHYYKSDERKYEWIEECVNNYHKHLNNCGFQKRSAGEEAENLFRTYMRNFIVNIKNYDMWKRCTEYDGLKKVEFLAHVWGKRVDYITDPNEYYYDDEMMKLGKGTLTKEKYVEKLLKKLKDGVKPKVTVYLGTGDKVWKEVKSYFGDEK